MLAGGIVEPGGGAPGVVVAFVAVNVGASSRLFKLSGRTDAARVEELPSATTVDLGRFERELREELGPEVAKIESLGGAASIARPRTVWVCDQVMRHLRASDG